MKFSHTLETDAPEKVWQRWLDVASWNEWDTELQSAALTGKVKLGTKGTLKPRTGPSSSFTITEFTPEQSYTFTTELPLCQLHIRRYFSAQRTAFTHEVSFTGALSPLFGFLLGRRFRTVLPVAMQTLRDLAESRKNAGAS